MQRLTEFLRENLRLLIGLTVVIFLVILIASVFITKFANPKVSINNKIFEVEVADTNKEQQLGLSGKKKLDINKGMLFVFEKPDFYSFWMRNMNFPIDIIYINGNKVTTVFSNAPVPTDSNNLEIYQPKSQSDKVLEINAGLAKKYNITEGSTIDINNL